MLPEKIIFIGVAINLFCSIWYIRTIIYNNTKPNLVSWFLWMLAPFVGFFLQLKAGAGLSSLGIFMAGFGPLLVMIVCLFRRSAIWKIKFFDVVCGFFSLMALVLYMLTNNLWLSILFAILSDALAYVPTFIKAWKYPETESSSTYAGGVINNIFALLVIKNWTFSIYSFSTYVIVANLLMVYAIYRKKIFKRKVI